MLNISEYKKAKGVFTFFEEISKIPHGSENTKMIADYLVDFAKTRGLSVYRDNSDNVIIKKPATKGYENRPTVIFQGHTDMVADKVKGNPIDMEKEGLKIFRDGDFIRAEGTTLGGDDGVALAYALAVLDANDIEHPAFEALFTSDEEIGLIGATALDASHLDGKTMINIDSDVEGVFTVGCAGGMRIDIKITAKKESVCGDFYKISVSGLKGGHSGTEIDKDRVNAIKLLNDITAHIPNIRISSISGGNADNAIPRSAECVFSAAENTEHIVSNILIPSAIENAKKKEPDVKITFEKIQNEPATFNIDDSSRVFKLIKNLPCGVVKMSDEIPGLVETSANIGILASDEESITLSMSIRSSKNDSKELLRQSIRAIAEDKNISATVSERGEYPAWEYKKDSHLRGIMKSVYVKMYGKEPEIITIHAGLECGIFSDKIPELDCVSIGPDNFDIHTPDERLSISSTARVWEYLKEVLKNI